MVDIAILVPCINLHSQYSVGFHEIAPPQEQHQIPTSGWIMRRGQSEIPLQLFLKAGSDDI